MSEKPKSSKPPLITFGAKLRFFMDRLRMPRVKAELVLVERLISRMRREIDDRTISLKWGSDRLDDEVVASLHGLVRKDPGEIAAEGRRRMALEKNALEKRVDLLEGLMAIRYRYLRVLEGGLTEPELAALPDLGLEADLRRLETEASDPQAKGESCGGGPTTRNVRGPMTDAPMGPVTDGTRGRKKEYLN